MVATKPSDGRHFPTVASWKFALLGPGKRCGRRTSTCYVVPKGAATQLSYFFSSIIKQHTQPRNQNQPKESKNQPKNRSRSKVINQHLPTSTPKASIHPSIHPTIRPISATLRAITTEDFRKQGPSTAQVEVSKDGSGPSRRSGRKNKGRKVFEADGRGGCLGEGWRMLEG